MDPMEAIKATFFQECEELLADLEAGLLALENGEGDAETVNAVFRAVHSVKGGAGAFGLEPLVRFAHVFETTLELMRSGVLSPEGEAIKIMLRAADVLADHVQAAKGLGVVDEGRSAVMVAELKSLTEGDVSDAGPSLEDGLPGFAPVGLSLDDLDAMPGLDFQPIAIDIDGPADLMELPDLGDLPDLNAAAATVWRVVIRPRSDMYAKANDAALLLRELERLGLCQTVYDDAALPDFDALDPEASYLNWTVELTAEVSEADIREVFEFVDGDCDVQVSRPDAKAPAAAPDLPDLSDLPDLAPPVPESLLSQTPVVIPMEDFAPAFVAAPEPPAPAPAKPPAARAAPGPAVAEARAASEANAPQATIRVDLERVDRLIDLVGELVINQAMLAQRVLEADIARSSGVAMTLDELEQLTREIQDSCMAIRAQPVKSVFQRMPRLVREVAAMTGKHVRLVTEGEGTEVDKTVIERLADPLTHMIRNAVDHGLETPEERVAAGKPAEGVVKLSARHRSGRIVIEVADDGKGINRPRVRQIAVDKGLIDPNAVLTDDEIDNLIFLPGFSTAAAVSDISGRGVGMDVVRRSIQALGGRITISSRPGEGSAFTMSLPLTLAVLDGMVVTCGEQTLVAPLSAIVETLQPKAHEVRRFGPKGALLTVRDTYVPLIDVGVALGWRTTPASGSECVALLVETEGGGRAAVLVDAIQGQRQVVIKSLESNYQRVDGVAAATILGDGRVALILDLDAVVAAGRSSSNFETPTLAQAS